jgi:magnesium transporter
MSETELYPWEKLRDYAALGDQRRLQAYIDSLPPSEAVRAMFRLDPEHQEKVLTTLMPAEAADLIEDLPDEHAAEMIERLPASDAASILSEMRSDEQADLLGDMDKEDAEAILAEMDPEDAEDVRRLVVYPDDVAGGLMMTEFLSFMENARVQDVIDNLSVRAEQHAEYTGQHAYVVSASGKLVGVVGLRDLVLSRRGVPLADIMASPLFVSVDTPLNELAAFFDRYDFLSTPVVDSHHGLVGVLRRSDVARALAERAEAERMKLQGIVGGDEIRSMPILTRSRRRLSWLSLNILLNIIAASVIALYEDTLSAVIALAVFLPIVSDMSGCSGNQAVAVSLRELALGIVKPFEILRVWLKEIAVGIINGLALGFLLAVAALLWKGNPYLGLVVGSALAINTMVSVSIGGTVPLLLKRVGMDPAVAASPILTTITDMFGFFLVLSFAAALMPLLSAS